MPIYKYYTAQGCLAQGFTVFSYVSSYFWKSGVWGLEKPIVAIIEGKHLIFKNKKLHIKKNWSVFNILVIF